MAIQRDNPYGAFNFLVDLGTGSSDGPDGGFAECSGIGMEVAVVEYRNGNDKENHPRKVAGLAKVADVTLRRGIIGSLALFRLIDDARNGLQSPRTVTITLLSETRDPVLVWRLERARIIKHTSGPLNAEGSDVAMEEIVIAYERLDLE